MDDFSPQLFYRLLNVSQAELAAMQDVGEELAARIYKKRLAFTTAEEFADRIKTRQVTHTRVTRALCHILLLSLIHICQTERGAGHGSDRAVR